MHLIENSQVNLSQNQELDDKENSKRQEASLSLSIEKINNYLTKSKAI
jgi:hypothetical protein